MITENVRAWIKEQVAFHNKYVDQLISVHKNEEYEEWIDDLEEGPAPTIEEWEEEGNYSGAHNAIDVDEVAQSVYCVAIESLFDEFGVTFDFSIEMSEDSGKLDSIGGSRSSTSSKTNPTTARCMMKTPTRSRQS